MVELTVGQSLPINKMNPDSYCKQQQQQQQLRDNSVCCFQLRSFGAICYPVTITNIIN